MIRRLALALCAVALIAAAPQTTLTDIEDEVMCPTCGVALNIAESPQADEQRALIRDLVADGLTKDEVKDRLVAEYGSTVLADPPDEGFGKASWLVPLGVVAALRVGAALLLPRWRRRSRAAADAEPTGGGPAISAADERRLDEDLARFR